MPAAKKYEKLIQRLFREVDPTIRVTGSNDRLNYHFQIAGIGEEYEFVCLRKPLDDENIQEVRRLRDQFLLSRPK